MLGVSWSEELIPVLSEEVFPRLDCRLSDIVWTSDSLSTRTLSDREESLGRKREHYVIKLFVKDDTVEPF